MLGFASNMIHMRYNNRPLFRIQKHVSICQPSIRMVVLYLYYYSMDGKPKNLSRSRVTVEHEIYNVVAIRTVIEEVYRRKTNEGVNLNSIEEFRFEDWDFVKTEVRDDVLFAENTCINAGRLATLQDLPVDDAISCVIACPWPYEDDKVRLAKLIEPLAETLRDIAVVGCNHRPGVLPMIDDADEDWTILRNGG